MSHKSVQTWMTPTPITISPEETILAAYSKMRTNHIRRLPVVEKEILVGIITITDIRGFIPMTTRPVPEREDLIITKKKVSEIMTSNPITIAQEESVGEAARLMMKNKIGGLPVLENGKLVGVISESDLFRLVIAENWRPQITGGSSLDGDEIVSLANGEIIHIRPIRPDDTIRLQALHVQMSPETIYDRFMGYKNVLFDKEARYLSNLDYDRHMALVATSKVNGEENITGVARYHVMDNEQDAAEFAVVISDSYQRKGLGTHLMKRLMEYAQAHDISIFLGFAHADNMRLLRFVQRSGLPVERKLKGGVWELRVKLTGEPFQSLNK